MKAFIEPAQMGGKINAIASKSYAHRMLLCAMLSDSQVELKGTTFSKDIEATLNCVKALGFDVQHRKDGYMIKKAAKPSENIVLDCIESGSTLRFIIPIALALGKECEVIGKEGLAKRPLKDLLDTLRQNGAIIYGDCLPLRLAGKLRAGDYRIKGDISSQYITGLMMALPLLEGDSTITIDGDIVSSKYLDITKDVLKDFGIRIEDLDGGYYIQGNQKYKPTKELKVQGDWSNAAFWLALGALNKEVKIAGLSFESVQGDREILQILMDMGAKVSMSGNELMVAPGKLHSITLDAKDIPDLVPIVSVVMTRADGISTIKNVDRLRIKETDRLQAVLDVLKKMGIQARYVDEELQILGGKIKSFEVDSYNDHRMVMMAAIAASIADGKCQINNIEAVNKSYPAFFDDYKALGGRVNVK